MTDRQLIVVDTETTGLNLDRAVVVELAAVNVDTGEEFYLVPLVVREDLAKLDPEAMAINRYFERRLHDQMPDWSGTTKRMWEFADWVDGHTFAGSNPRFDAAMIEKLLDRHDAGPSWHHRLADISPYAAGALGLDPTDLPGLDRVCAALGVVNEDPHTAMGDARATAECFRRVREISRRAAL